MEYGFARASRNRAFCYKQTIMLSCGFCLILIAWNTNSLFCRMINLVIVVVLLSTHCVFAALTSQEVISTSDNQLTPALRVDGDDNRHLQTYNVLCPGGGPLNYFRLDIQFQPQPSVDLTKCTLELQQRIGVDLNALLLNYGIGQQGVGDNAVYLASVCTKPSTLNNRRRLALYGFVWKGGGSCRQCPGDNRDSRRLLRRLYDPNWFRNIYIPEMQNTLRNPIVQTIVPGHRTCLGEGPQVFVTITEVSQSQLNTGC